MKCANVLNPGSGDPFDAMPEYPRANTSQCPAPGRPRGFGVCRVTAVETSVSEGNALATDVYPRPQNELPGLGFRSTAERTITMCFFVRFVEKKLLGKGDTLATNADVHTGALERRLSMRLRLITKRTSPIVILTHINLPMWIDVMPNASGSAACRMCRIRCSRLLGGFKVRY